MDGPPRRCSSGSPPLELPVLGALAALAGAVAWDALLLQRRPPLVLERSVPPRAFVAAAGVARAAPPLCGGRPGRGARRAAARRRAQEPRASPRCGFRRGEPVVLSYAVRPQHRGDRALGRPLGLERSPLGLLRRRVVGETGGAARLSGYDAPAAPAGLDPKRALASLGARPARRRGDGTEFESLRDYAPGDDPRRLDWAASARREPAGGAPPSPRAQPRRAGGARREPPDGRARRRTHASSTSRWMRRSASSTRRSPRATASALAVFDRELRVHLRAARAAVPRSACSWTRCGRSSPASWRPTTRASCARSRGSSGSARSWSMLTDFVEAESQRLAGPFAVLGRRHRVLLVAVRDPIFTRLDPRGRRGRRAKRRCTRASCSTTCCTSGSRRSPRCAAAAWRRWISSRRRSRRRC